MKSQIIIEQLAEQLGSTVWSKGDLKRIYLNSAGWNTKKMSTKTFIFQEENGNFKVSCRIECPSKGDSWISSQEQQVKESIYEKINSIISDEVFVVYDLDDNLPINEIGYSDIFYSMPAAEERARKDWKGCNYEIRTYNKDEFSSEVERLNMAEQSSVTEIENPINIKNLQLSDKVFIGTGKAISDNGLFPHIQPNDTQIMLWIKWHWGITDNKENFAPMVELFSEKQENTHRLKNYPYYFHLNNNPDGTIPFESFITRFIEIARL